MSIYYDRKGQPITQREWADAQRYLSAKVVEQTNLADGKFVSTVWLGMDLGFGRSGAPVIFETMVFPSDNLGNELDCYRYSTEEEAKAGHAAAVEKWTKEVQP